MLGDKSSPYRFMCQAIDINFYCHACFIRDPLLVSLHGETQYAELINLARARATRNLQTQILLELDQLC